MEKKPSSWSGASRQPSSRPRTSKRRWAIVWVSVLVVGALGAWLLTDAGPDQAEQSSITRYQCPMHPQVIQEAPGSCPICGMDLVPMEKRETTTEMPGPSSQYSCPMHPTIVSESPGSCPICGMDLVLMPERPSDVGASTVPGMAAVSIPPEERQRMGLRLSVVEKRDLSREVRTSARVLVDETRQVRVTTKIEGWIDKLYVATTGQPVSQGDRLLTIYSPELVSAEEEYLSALATQSRLESADSLARRGGRRLAEAARRRLELWDISDEQIRRLEETGRVEKYLTLYAPASGWVIERMVLPGQKVMPSEPLLVIADLTTVWVDADIYQSDLPHVQMGMDVQLELPAWPGKSIHGRVSFITPTLDPETRTMRARLEVANPELLLKPEMYATARLRRELGVRLAVPGTAIMFTGSRTFVFRAGDVHQLIPVEVQLGERSGDYYEVRLGLNENDSVVVSANFLVDSESSLAAALAAISGGSPAGHTTPQSHSGH